MDANKIQDAIDQSFDKGLPYRPDPGVYHIDKQINLQPGVVIEGGNVDPQLRNTHGVVWNFSKCQDSLAVAAQGSYNNTRVPCMMRNITIAGGNNRYGTCGVGITNGQRLTHFENVNINGFATGAALLLGFTWLNTFRNCMFRQSRHGVAVQDGTIYKSLNGLNDTVQGNRTVYGIDFYSCTIEHNTEAGIYLGSAACLGLNFFGGTVEGNAQTYIPDTLQGQYVVGPFCKGINLQNVWHEWGNHYDSPLILLHGDPNKGSYSEMFFSGGVFDQKSNSAWVHRVPGHNISSGFIHFQKPTVTRPISSLMGFRDLNSCVTLEPHRMVPIVEGSTAHTNLIAGTYYIDAATGARKVKF